MLTETPLDVLANVLALVGSILVLAAVGFFRPEPMLDWREAMFTPFWEQRDQFKKPGYQLFTGGLGLVGVRIVLTLVNKVVAGL